jgi:hypothetical protein
MNSNQIIELALGRLFRIASRPAQASDTEMYYKIRAIVMEQIGDAPQQYRPNYARDRLLGAQGD